MTGLQALESRECIEFTQLSNLAADTEAIDKTAIVIEVDRLVVDKQATSTVFKFVEKEAVVVSYFRMMKVEAVSNLYLVAFNYDSDPHLNFLV